MNRSLRVTDRNGAGQFGNRRYSGLDLDCDWLAGIIQTRACASRYGLGVDRRIRREPMVSLRHHSPSSRAVCLLLSDMRVPVRGPDARRLMVESPLAHRSPHLETVASHSHCSQLAVNRPWYFCGSDDWLVAPCCWLAFFGCPSALFHATHANQSAYILGSTSGIPRLSNLRPCPSS